MNRGFSRHRARGLGGRRRLARITGAAALLLAAGPLLWLLARGEAPPPVPSPEEGHVSRPGDVPTPERAHRVRIPSPDPATEGGGLSPDPAAGSPPPPPRSLRDLLGTLADHLRAGRDIAGDLASLLRDPSVVWQVLDRLRSPSEEDPPEVLQAAIFLVGIVLENGSGIVEHLPSWETFPTGAFVEALLEAIPHVPSSARAAFVSALVASCGLEGSLLDAGRIFEVDRLRLQSPEEEGYRRLLVRMIETGDPSLLETFAIRAIGESKDGAIREASIALLLRRDPELFLPLALTLLDHGALRPRVRHPAARALARELPPGQALELLLPRIDDVEGGLFLPWASDSSRRREAARAYKDLLVTNRWPTARAALLDAGVGGEGPVDWILEAARLDPDPRVTGRAWIALSSRADVPGEDLRELRAAYHEGRLDGKNALAAACNWARSHPDLALESASLASEILAADPLVLGPQGGMWLRGQFADVLDLGSLDRLFPR